MRTIRNSYDEYLLLGQQLKQTTQAAIAKKFEVRADAISLISKLDNDDVRLIREMLNDRAKMLKRREQLRFDLGLQHEQN